MGIIFLLLLTNQVTNAPKRSSGGTSLKAPAMGWDSGDLEAIFSQTVPRDRHGLGSDTSGPTNTLDPARLTAKSNNDDIGDNRCRVNIAGIAIGVAAVIAIIVGVLAWLKRMRAKNPKGPVKSTGAFKVSDNQWQKPELDASNNTRYELGISEPRPHELHNNGIIWELASAHRPIKLP